MPVYNGARFLGEAIASILAQTYRDLELIVSDDGSTDGSLEVAEAYARKDARVIVVQSQHGGIGAAMNRGLAVARGRFFAPMDQDDIASPDRLARSVAFLDAHAEIALVGGAAHVIDESGKILGKKTRPQSPANVAAAMHFSTAVIHPASMMRTEAVRAVGGYRSVLPFAEDYDLWLRLLERDYQMANLPEVVLSKRRHAGQVTNNRARRPAQAVTRAIVYLSYLSRVTYGRDMLSEEGSPLASTSRFVAFHLARCGALSTSALHNIARFARYAPIAGDGSAGTAYVALLRKSLRTGGISGASRSLWYLALYFARNRWRQHELSGFAVPAADARLEPLVDAA
jgi:glycosyltransferase involved in cell wall biosynthesis